MRQASCEAMLNHEIARSGKAHLWWHVRPQPLHGRCLAAGTGRLQLRPGVGAPIQPAATTWGSEVCP